MLFGVYPFQGAPEIIFNFLVSCNGTQSSSYVSESFRHFVLVRVLVCENGRDCLILYTTIYFIYYKILQS